MPQHILLVGDSTDLPAIHDLLRELPPDSYGQVYLEVATAIQIRSIAAPPGVSVSWLCRDRHSSDVGGSPRDIGAMARRGELASRAIAAWVAEWQPDASSEGDYLMWIGCSASARVGRLYRALQERLGEPQGERRQP